MYTSLNIDIYKKSYPVSYIGCIDQPIAGAAGYYNYENYYYYCFFLSMLKNWRKLEITNYLEIRNLALKKIGLKLVSTRINDKTLLIKTLKDFIDKNIPPILITKRSSLSYSSDYNNKDNNNLHGILISGYSFKSDVIELRDIIHIESSGLDNINKSYGLYKLYLKHSVIEDIWYKSNTELITLGEKFFNNNIFTVEAELSTSINYKQLLEIFISELEVNDNILATTILNFNYENIQGKHHIIKQFYSSLKVIFDVINNILKEQNITIEFVDRFNEFQKEYMKIRYSAIFEIIKYSTKKNNITINSKERLASSVIKNDRMLLKIINELYSII